MTTDNGLLTTYNECSAVKRPVYRFIRVALLDFLRARKIFMDKPPFLLTINGLKGTA